MNSDRRVPDSTCWTLLHAAAHGSVPERETLARRYLPIVRTYLQARWRGTALATWCDDAAQEVFVECFRQGGALAAVEAGRVPNFRPFLYGIVRNVARRFESRQVRSEELVDVEASEPSFAQQYDRVYAQAMMADAAQRQRANARVSGPDAEQRVELLRLRFEEGLPIRTIAARWNVPAAGLHHAYALARKEFKAALLDVLAQHHDGSRAELEQEAADLLHLLA